MSEQQEKEQASPFRVVDRRRFTEEGETRAPREVLSPNIPAGSKRFEGTQGTATRQSESGDHKNTERRDAVNRVSTGSHTVDDRGEAGGHAPIPPPSQDAQAGEENPRESLGRGENPREEARRPCPQKGTQPPLTFAVFMQSLGQQAMMAMGLLPWPDTGLIKVDLQRAQEMIDVIGLLRDKTKGNLTHDEQQLCDALLYQLRIAFVQIRESGGPPAGVGTGSAVTPSG